MSLDQCAAILSIDGSRCTRPGRFHPDARDGNRLVQVDLCPVHFSTLQRRGRLDLVALQTIAFVPDPDDPETLRLVVSHTEDPRS